MTLPVRPILSALWRRKTGAALIATQVALTLAILCNALFIVHERSQRSVAATGVAEPEVFFVSYVTPDYADRAFDVQRRDEALARAVPGVQHASWVNQMPLTGSGTSSSIPLGDDDSAGAVSVSVYVSGGSLIETLGLRLIEGRDFEAGEFEDIDRRVSTRSPGVVIVTAATARALFPGAASAIGRSFKLGSAADDPTLTVVGVVDRLLTPWGPASWNREDPDGELSMILPARTEQPGMLAVRADAARIDAIGRAVAERLKAAEPGRIQLAQRSMAEVRARRFADDLWLARLLSVVLGLLLLMTAAGIVGLASLWVTQRRKQIGVRRALGARRRDVVQHFQLENLMITTLGVLAGLTLAVGFNQLLVRLGLLSALPPTMLAGGAVVMLILGQAAVLGPALRAARITPAEATRGA